MSWTRRVNIFNISTEKFMQHEQALNQAHLRQEKESLKDEMRNVSEEARMVIPGIQALFGFQTISVFNQRFESISHASKAAYLAVLGLLVLAIGAADSSGCVPSAG